MPGQAHIGGIVALLACLLAAPAAADVPTTTATTVTTAPTSTLSSTTVGTTTTPPPSTTVVTTETATQPPATTSAATVTTATTPAATPTASRAAVTARPFGGECSASAAMVVMPHRLPLLLGPVAAVAGDVGALSRLDYSAQASIVSGSNVEVAAGRCTRAGVHGATARIDALSLFGGAVTASRVGLVLGAGPRQTITGLQIAGAPVAARAGRHLSIHGWGVVTIGTGRPQALGGTAVAALSLVLLRPHDGLPEGTTILIATLGVPARAASSRHHGAAPAHHRRRRARHGPLKITPPLEASGYVFPVVGPGAAFVDTYGGFRSDVPGHWHHGDDIFAPLGTPVVATATGTIDRVGWERVGGWRLWVRDGAGDEFYYAHLSGFTPADLHSNHVRAGEVIGFIGNTGDAFTTSPHLHFEIHPRSLLHLGYDGAVDPTRYLDGWPHLNHVVVPRPAHPRLPTRSVFAQEARYVWRELLVARHLIRRPPAAGTRPQVPIPSTGVDSSPVPITVQAAPRAAPAARHSAEISPATIITLAVAALLATAALAYIGVTGVRRARASRLN